MPKHIKNLLKVSSLIIAITITIGIAVLSLLKIEKQSPIGISNIDKLGHAIAYCVLTFSWLMALANNKKQKIIIVIFCFLFGIIIEVLQQTITTYRTAELADIFANGVGVVIALLIFSIFFKKK